MTADRVREYYDRNTRGFLRFGQGGRVAAIHRAVWAPGIDDRMSAFRYVDTRLQRELGALGVEAPTVLDLGCGVGASLLHLARGRSKVCGIGVTLSPVQVDIAREKIAASGMAERVRCLEADYTALPAEIEAVDFAYAIESFVHGPSPAAFFGEVARVVRPGGRLVIVDDFVGRAPRDARERRAIEELRRGRHARSLVTPAEADEAADGAGFDPQHDENWSPYLELRRPRDRLIAGLVTLGRHVPIAYPWWLNLLGGNALQEALANGLVEYRFHTFTRR